MRLYENTTPTLGDESVPKINSLMFIIIYYSIDCIPSNYFNIFFQNRN